MLAYPITPTVTNPAGGLPYRILPYKMWNASSDHCSGGERKITMNVDSAYTDAMTHEMYLTDFIKSYSRVSTHLRRRALEVVRLGKFGRDELSSVRYLREAVRRRPET